MTRLNAFFIHIAISSLIFLVLLYFIVYHWYPFPYFSSDGGWQGIRIIAGVDLVLGPLLTLIVFKPGKKSLKFDMSVIALIQFGSLSWGVWVTYDQKPFAVVFSEYYFKPITLNELREVKADVTSIPSLSKEKPYLIYLDIPAEVDKLRKLQLQALRTAQPLYMFHQLYSPFSTGSIELMQKQSLDLNAIIGSRNDINKSVMSQLQQYMAKEQYLYFPLKARYKYEIAVFDPSNYKIIDTIDLNPLIKTGKK